MAEPKVTKIEVARRHFDAGIEMLFGEIDITVIHTVFFAASEVLKDLCNHVNKKSQFDQAAEDRIKPEFRKEYYQLTRKHAIFFKHAQKDPEGEAELFVPEVNDFLALSALMRFETLGQKLTPHMAVFANWFGWSHPHCLRRATEGAAAEVTKMFADLSRPERLLFGRMVLAQSLGDGRELRHVSGTIERRFPQTYARFLAMVDNATSPK